MSVIVDSYGKDEFAWRVVSLSDTESVKGLLRLRRHFDLLYKHEDLGMNSTNVDLGEQLEDVTCTYAWLDKVVSNTTFSEQQISILDRYMDGYDVEEIAEEDGVTERNINKVLNTICKKITVEEERQWATWVHKNKLKSEMRVCISCGEELPLNQDFFRILNSDTNSYKKQCRKCESTKRKVAI